MGWGPSKLEQDQAEHERVMEEKRKAQLEKAQEDADRDRTHIKITEPRTEKNGKKVGKLTVMYKGADEGVPYATKIAQTNEAAIEYEEKRRALCDS